MLFGGVKSSGYGCFGGKVLIVEFIELCWIILQNMLCYYLI